MLSMTEPADCAQCAKSELPLLYEAGALHDSTMMWTEGMDDWHPLGDVKDWLGLAGIESPAADLAQAEAAPEPEPEPEPKRIGRPRQVPSRLPARPPARPPFALQHRVAPHRRAAVRARGAGA